MVGVRRLALALEDAAWAVADALCGVVGFILGVAALLYLVFQGPNVSGWTRIDDRCYVHTFHDHRLFAADPPEVTTVYCEERR